MKYLVHGLVLFGFSGALAACGDGTPDPMGHLPRIELFEGQRPIVADTSVTVRADLPLTITVENTGSAVLAIKSIVADSSPAGAFTITSLPTPSDEAPVEVWPEQLAHTFAIEYHPDAVPAGVNAAATVRLHTNLTLNSGTDFAFTVTPEVPQPKLVISPATLDFAEVATDTSITRTANLLNTGAAPLTIQRVIFGGHLGFTATFGGVTYEVTAESAANGITLATPITIAAGSAEKVDVQYHATGAEAARGKLVFFSNDPSAPSGTELDLLANLEGPCIKTNPPRVSFGGKIVGQASEIALEIQSCGDVDLVLSDIAMIEDGNGAFAVDEARLGTWPVTVPAGSSVYVPVTYFPAAVAALGADGQFVKDLGKLRISSNAYVAELDVDVDGFGTDGRCPTAKISVAEGYEVAPQTLLHLDGSGSTTNNGVITGWKWSAVQPGGSQFSFQPSDEARSPTIEANLVGEFLFRLEVTDSAGIKSCEPAEVTVLVTATDAIHVELVWHNPGDINEADTGGDDYWSAGSDVDLHFLHPKAYEQYFDPFYDCYWGNPVPEWGTFSPDDNPRLDRDDTDGAGPENLNVESPEANTRYQVGVHYWNEWGYGPALATVKVYIYGALRDHWDDVELRANDMWDSHFIDWPSGAVTRIGNQPRITHNYL